MNTSDEIVLITVAGGQMAFDAALRGGMEAKGITYREVELEAEVNTVLDALEAGARPVVLKPVS